MQTTFLRTARIRDELLRGEVEIVGEAYGVRDPDGEFDVRLPNGLIIRNLSGRYLERSR